MNSKGGRGTVYLAAVIMASFAAVSNSQSSSSSQTARNKIFAQKLVEETLAAHPEITGLELASTPLGKNQCVTIASNETKGLGEKCDEDEFTAMKTNKPFVEKETEDGKEVYDITMPIHDVQGKIIATAGIDFKPEPNQQESKIVAMARQIAQELEQQTTSKEKLFKAAD
jgi:hypothetical protein